MPESPEQGSEPSTDVQPMKTSFVCSLGLCPKLDFVSKESFGVIAFFEYHRVVSVYSFIV